MTIEIPHAGAHGMIVRVTQVRRQRLVTGEVKLSDALPRDGVEKGGRIEPVVVRADEHVVDVQQEAAVGALGERGQKLRLAHRRVPVGQVAGDVLHQDPTPEPLLHARHARRHVRQRLLGERQRPQIVRAVTAEARPAEVVRDPGRLDLRRQRRQPIEVAGVQRIGRPERHRHPVEHDRAMRARRAQHSARVPPLAHEVLADHLPPVDGRGGHGAGGGGFVERGAQAEPLTESGKSLHPGNHCTPRQGGAAGRERGAMVSGAHRRAAFLRTPRRRLGHNRASGADPRGKTRSLASARKMHMQSRTTAAQLRTRPNGIRVRMR